MNNYYPSPAMFSNPLVNPMQLYLHCSDVIDGPIWCIVASKCDRQTTWVNDRAGRSVWSFRRSFEAANAHVLRPSGGQSHSLKAEEGLPTAGQCVTKLVGGYSPVLCMGVPFGARCPPPSGGVPLLGTSVTGQGSSPSLFFRERS